jgi:CheY-like chemotaxis protein
VKALDLLMKGSVLRKTLVAFDGLEAIQAAANSRPDVVLLDIGLPEMNGYEVARAIKKEAWGKFIFLVALTGWGQEEDKTAGVRCRFRRAFDQTGGGACARKAVGSEMWLTTSENLVYAAQARHSNLSQGARPPICTLFRESFIERNVIPKSSMPS